ncbi:hypothetical protein PR048_003037 [Dryococelus australis]|uniref:Uncharacterized protein n=1 Tax=Dryococelus australis TaxID=614101 RepID=A0ABQ9ILY9_9NEOP|nr:hypothetical protein PR048_003037 [Dryococelus australis]
MPPSGPVYQPTTVTYEQQSDWMPVSYLSQTVGNGMNRSRCMQWFLLIVGLFILAAGLIMVIEAAVDYADSRQNDHELELNRNDRKDDYTKDVVIMIGGALLGLLGIMLLSGYFRMSRRRKGCPCFPSKEQRLARQLDNQASNGQVLTLNPSTDLLVTAQYAPVSEISYQPPAVSEEEETRKLMGSDNKEW